MRGLLTPAQAALSAVGLAVVGALVLTVLIVTGHAADAGLVLGLIGPIITALLVTARLDANHADAVSRLDAQDSALHTITRQTNGVLTARIREAVAQALAEREGAAAALGSIPRPRTEV